MGAVVKFRGCQYMPLQLKAVMLRYGIGQEKLASRILQHDGRPMSHTALSLLMNWGYWPKKTKQEDIRAQVEAQLAELGVLPEDIAGIWAQEGEEDPHRHKHPDGVHLGQPAPKPPRSKRAQYQEEPEIEPLEVEVLTPAAKKQFRLFRDPFVDDVHGPEDLFLADDQRYIREAMYQTAKHGGFLAVVGESGAGKSVLRRDLLDRIGREGSPIIIIFPQIIDKTRLNAGSICQAIVDDLQPGAKVKSDPEARSRQIKELLTSSSRAGNSHALLIEEAHDLNINTLKYLKRFWELEDGFKRLLSIILVGQPELKDRLDERRNPDAREVIRRCEIAELMPLDHTLQDYLAHKFKRINADFNQVFEPDACDAIRTRLTRTRPGTREVLSQVYPLVVNNLATKAMNRAAELGMPVVNGQLIEAL